MCIEKINKTYPKKLSAMNHEIILIKIVTPTLLKIISPYSHCIVKNDETLILDTIVNLQNTIINSLTNPTLIILDALRLIKKNDSCAALQKLKPNIATCTYAFFSIY